MRRQSREHPCRASSRHTVQLRQSRGIVAAARSLAAGAALPVRPFCRTRSASRHPVNYSTRSRPTEQLRSAVTFPAKVEKLRVEIDLVAEIDMYNPFDFFLDRMPNTFPFTR